MFLWTLNPGIDTTSIVYRGIGCAQCFLVNTGFGVGKEGDLECRVGIDENRVRVDIAMYNACRVKVLEGTKELIGEIPSMLDGQEWCA